MPDAPTPPLLPVHEAPVSPLVVPSSDRPFTNERTSVFHSQGAVTGTTQDELMTALSTGARRLLFGKLLNELSRMLPAQDDHDIIQIAAEARLLYGHDFAEQLANAIHHRAHLTADARPTLQLVLYELLSNAIEHGNLGLTSARTNMVTTAAWFDDYHAKVKETLATPLGRIPIMITCRRLGNDLEVVIEDRGLGFSVKQVMANMHGPENPTGRGLGLVFALLNNRVEYSHSGRRVTFKMPLRHREEHNYLPNRTSAREHGRILVIDDQTVNLRVANMAFRNAGFSHITLCQDPKVALEQARITKPDLILLDISMPEIDGYVLCGKFKEDSELSNIPIVFFTGYGDAASRTKGYQMGAVDFVTKPIDPTELVARSEIHLLNGMMMRTLQKFAERMHSDLERARGFQFDLLPSAKSLMDLASRHDLDLATTYQGCDTLAGDYWNIFNLDDDNVAVCLVDFTGHGVIAALNTVQLHTLLHNTNNLLNKPVLVAQTLNYHLHQLLGTGSFATFVYGVLNTKTGDFTYAGGGAPPMMIRRADCSLENLDCSGLPLGLSPDIEVPLRKAKLEKGDTLILVSDALTDSPHNNGQRWGVDGLNQIVRDLPCGMKTSLFLSMLLDVFYATVLLPVPDDLTALALTLGRKSEVTV